ncbi:hypothetical protein JZ751_025897 [Albula glossodonta]|uniref:IRG-type G domain-containing protein n=1 Tax=Albula glossodonta TaxID=121402 RepID=A0A8T2NGB4_9TELE|nr:hypothetical protein JZ751_025897 [Albula glossodonta]
MNKDNAGGFMSPDELQVIQETIETESLGSAAQKIQEYFEQLDKTELHIAVTGVSGKGKSTFVNAIRGLGDEDEGSAPTGVVETTMEPTPYHHPNYPNVTFWDLPGIGRETFSADQFLDKVGFHRYDFFIIISSERFTSHDANLGKAIQKMGKHFYFIRSKIDESLRAKRVRKSNYDEKATLDQIRQDCISGLQKFGVGAPKVFLISSFELDKYDFPQLQEAMEKELPKEKRHVFLLALPNLSVSVYQRKKELLQANIWKLALLSATVAAVPIPGLGFGVDVKLLAKEINKYKKAFGLDEASLKHLSKQVNVPVLELKKATRSGFDGDITDGMVIKMLAKVAGGELIVPGKEKREMTMSDFSNETGKTFSSMLSKLAGGGLMAAKEHLSCFVGIGTVAAGGIAFWVTRSMLKSCLEKLAEDAHCVMVRAFPNEGREQAHI